MRSFLKLFGALLVGMIFVPTALADNPLQVPADNRLQVPSESFGLPKLTNPSAGMLDVIGRLITFMAGLIGTVAVLSLLYAAYIYVIAGGSNTVETRSGDVEKAKKIVNWVIIGLVVAALSWSIVNILLNLAPLKTGA